MAKHVAGDQPLVFVCAGAQVLAEYRHTATATPLVSVNFQPAGAAVPTGYVVDAGLAFANRGNGFSYGWVGGDYLEVRDRNLLSDQRLDTLSHMDHTNQDGAHSWELAVSNGWYAVTLTMGDAGFIDQSNHVAVEGRQLRDADPWLGSGSSGSDFDAYHAWVEVSDGLLTVSPGYGYYNPKLVSIEVSALGASVAEDLEREYVYGAYVDDPIAMLTPDGSGGFDATYYHSNHLYSVAAITDDSGSVLERYGYDAYGASVVTDASASNVLAGSAVGQPYRFTGRRLDGETGLSYFRARYKDHALGRFISRDDGYFDGYNLLASYLHANGVDPFGNSVLTILADPINLTSCGGFDQYVWFVVNADGKTGGIVQQNVDVSSIETCQGEAVKNHPTFYEVWRLVDGNYVNPDGSPAALANNPNSRGDGHGDWWWGPAWPDHRGKVHWVGTLKFIEGLDMDHFDQSGPGLLPNSSNAPPGWNAAEAVEHVVIIDFECCPDAEETCAIIEASPDPSGADTGGE